MGNLLTASGLTLDAALNQAYQYRVKLNDGTFVTGRQIAEIYTSNSSGNAIIRIDPTWYMSDGPGRYFNPEMIRGNAALALRTQLVGTYNLTQILSQDELSGSLSHYTTDVGSSDYIGRSFIFGGSSFRITGGTVSSDGSGNLTFSNVIIKPLDDNFDFNFSYKGGAALLFFEGIGYALNRRIDPNGVGRSVNLEFRESGETNTQGGLFISQFQGKAYSAPGAGFSTNARLEVRPPSCFLAGTMISMADGTKKPVEDIRPGDFVMSFDGSKNKGRGKLKAARVTKTFQNTAPLIINLRGLKVTPGHVFLNGDGDFEKIATILKKDGVIVDERGRLIRARTGALVGSIEDEFINVAYDDRMRPGRFTSCVVRAGILCPVGRSRKAIAPYFKRLRELGFSIKNACIVSPSGELTVPDWPEGKSPFDSEAQRNYVVRDEFGQLYTPPWIEALPETDEEVGQVRRNFAVAGAVARPN
jgi:hypothetical protein